MDCPTPVAEPAKSLTVGIDGAFVKAKPEEAYGRPFEILTGRVEEKRGRGHAFAVVRNLDCRAKQKVQAVLRRCGRDADTKLMLLSDGEDGMRGVVGWFGKNCCHRLDWFHVRRRFERIARDLLYLPHREKFDHYLSRHSRNLARVQYSLWNSGIEMADWYMKIFRCGLAEDAWDHPEIDIKRFQAIETKLDELCDYLYANSKAGGGYARAFRRGERVGTAHVESTVNQLINWRFCKKQQMASTKAGAQALLHVKTALLNGALNRYTRHVEPPQQPLDPQVFHGPRLMPKKPASLRNREKRHEAQEVMAPIQFRAPSSWSRRYRQNGVVGGDGCWVAAAVSPFPGVRVVLATRIVVMAFPARDSQEPVRHKLRVNVISRDCASRVNAEADRALEDNCAGAWKVELADGAVGSPHVIVKHAIGVIVVSRDRTLRVDAHGERALAGACTNTGSVELGNGAVRRPHETVIHLSCVTVVSCDRTRGVNVEGGRALALAGASTGNVELGDGAVWRAHETVDRVICVKVVPRDRTRRVNAEGEGAHRGTCSGTWGVELGGGAVESPHVTVIPICVAIVARDHTRRVNAKGERCASAWNVERCDGAVGSPHETVVHAIRVDVVSHDRARRVNAKGERCAGAWNVERGDGAVGSPHETVDRVICVRVVSRDRTGRVNVVSRDHNHREKAEFERSLFEVCAGRWGVEGNELCLLALPTIVGSEQDGTR